MNIIMVCLGNICRSPLAEGILEDKIQKYNLDWKVDSAGTSAWHEGEKPDMRSIITARNNNIDITNQQARQFTKDDFNQFDLILAMDQSNYNNILELAESPVEKDKVELILNHLYPGENRPVPDPYYDNGFDAVFQMLDQAIEKLIESKT